MARIETLMLANHAESINGLLYVHGGGWSHHWREPGTGARQSQFAVAATVLLAPGEGPEGVPFVLRILSSQGEEVLRADGMLQGPPTADGQEVRTGIAMNANVVFPHEGPYTLNAEIGGVTGPTVPFWVHDRPEDDGTAEGSGSSEPDYGGSAGYL